MREFGAAHERLERLDALGYPGTPELAWAARRAALEGIAAARRAVVEASRREREAQKAASEGSEAVQQEVSCTAPQSGV